MTNTIYNLIYNHLDNLPLNILIQLHNAYILNSNSYYEEIYNMINLSDNLCNINSLDLLKKVFNGAFNPYDLYYTFDVYDNLISFSNKNDENYNIDIDEITKYIVDNNDTLCQSHIRNILNNVVDY